MARYIDADALKNDILMKYKFNWEVPCSSEDRIIQRVVTDVRVLIEQSITADAVPRAGAENYKQIAEKQQKLAMDRYFEIKRLKEELANAKTEVAREIFEEIERKVKSLLTLHLEEINKEYIRDTPLYDRHSGIIFALQGMDDFIAELKKKYTEDSDES